MLNILNVEYSEPPVE